MKKLKQVRPGESLARHKLDIKVVADIVRKLRFCYKL